MLIKDKSTDFTPTSKYKHISNDGEDMWQSNSGNHYQNSTYSLRRWKNVGFFGACCFVLITIVCVVFMVYLTVLAHDKEQLSKHDRSTRSKVVAACNIRLVESIPVGMNYSQDSPKFMSTYDAWKTLLDIAENSVDIGSFYWTLRGEDVINHPTAAQGEDIFKRIVSNGKAIDDKLNIRIAQSIPTPKELDLDTELFIKYGAAEVRSLNFQKMLGGGVLHTKLWIVDNKHFYLGSANMDWRSLTQVKELGILAQNCTCLTEDVAKIFKAYWYLGLNTSTIPKHWPNEFSTQYNSKNPMEVNFNKNFTMSAFFSSSPPPLTAEGRLNDLDAILNTISSAQLYVHIAVMDYFPLLVYGKIKYWPYIDDALRSAAIDRHISIKMLISWWDHSNPAEDYFLKSLSSLSSSFKGVDIQIRRFVVPSNEDQAKIPFARVNHNKYMVTDNTAYIGTSNWSGDYFTNTAGIGLILKDNIKKNERFLKNLKTTVRADLESVFKRDWESPYALELHTHDLK